MMRRPSRNVFLYSNALLNALRDALAILKLAFLAYAAVYHVASNPKFNKLVTTPKNVLCA
jgi:hypothetical protein